MVSAAYYRKEAERCRALALGTNDAEAALRWNRIADDYQTLANAMQADGDKLASPSMMHVPMQQQPVQQQQAKTEPEDGK